MPIAYARSTILLFEPQASVASRDVTIAAPDGTKLSATYYAAAKPGPAVLLPHMCNTTRRSWDPLAPRLAAAGIHALSVDYRGFGDSGGPRATEIPPQPVQRVKLLSRPTDGRRTFRGPFRCRTPAWMIASPTC